MRVKEGYVEKRGGRSAMGKTVWRNWFLVKHKSLGEYGQIPFGANYSLILPKKYVGKRIRFKVEVIE